MSDEKRTIDGYVESHAIQIGSSRTIFAVKEDSEMPFMVCDHHRNNPLNIDEYPNAVAGDDYLELMTEFLSRVSAKIERATAERAERGISNTPLTAADCLKDSHHSDYKNQLVVIKPEVLTPSSRTSDHQLVLATGGFGCSPDASGRAVYCTNLYTGKETRFERTDIAGVIDPMKIPEWARERLAALTKKREKGEHER